MPIDLALAIEKLLTDALYHDASSYERLMATWFDLRPIPTEAELDQAWQDILDERAVAEQQEQADAAKTAAARQNANNIPGWASWDETEVQEWIDGKFDQTTIDNVSNMAEAKIVLGHMATAISAMARMMLALRDDTWPNLGN